MHFYPWLTTICLHMHKKGSVLIVHFVFGVSFLAGFFHDLLDDNDVAGSKLEPSIPASQFRNWFQPPGHRLLPSAVPTCVALPTELLKEPSQNQCHIGTAVKEQ